MQKLQNNMITKKTISLPYANGTVTAAIPAHISVGIASYDPALIPDGLPEKDQRDLITTALDTPISSPSLYELSRGVSSMVIITNDSTRYTPSNLSIPLMLERLCNPNSIDITILIATGMHRPMTQLEIDNQFSKELQMRCKIVNHDAFNYLSLVDLGLLSTGNRLFLNKAAVDCDLLIAEGSIEPHFFAGFTGGRKSVLPGIAGKSSILYNHRPQNIENPNSFMGNLVQNPIHLESTEAAVRSKLRFISNYVLNSSHHVVKAYSGDPVQAYDEACAYAKNAFSAPVPLADIVVTSNGGQPMDLNLYQTVKGIDAAAKIIKPGGIIIIASSCSEGIGSQMFAQQVTNCDSIESLCENMQDAVSIHDKWQAQIFARAIKNHKVILVSDLPEEKVKEFFLIPAKTLQEALDTALDEKGQNAFVSVLPYGPFTIPSPINN